VAPRAYWKGYLKLSLVSCPIALYPASSEREKISFHQLNKKTGNRIRYRKVDADTGDEVEAADIQKGYEVAKGQYIELEPEELDAVAIDSTRTIDIEEFVPRDEIDELYMNSPYFIAPDGEVGQQAFAVIREAINREGVVAIGRVVFTSREHIIALEARGKGMMGITLRYPYEVRKEEDYFDDITDEKVPKDMLDLAAHIVDTKKAAIIWQAAVHDTAASSSSSGSPSSDGPRPRPVDRTAAAPGRNFSARYQFPFDTIYVGKEHTMSVKGQIKEATGFVKDQANDHGKSAESQKKAHEGRDLRNESQVEDGKPPKTTKPGTGH
jgi:DNA end-binding protein Ku